VGRGEVPYPKKPDGEKRIPAGVSLPRRTVERLDALRGEKTRTAFVEELVEYALDARISSNWRHIADSIRSGMETAA
jgi:hypothetical protein